MTVKSNYEAIIALLPQLTQKELQEVRGRAGFLMQGSAEHDDAAWALSHIAYYIRDKGGEHATVTGLKRSNMYPAFADKAPRIVEWINAAAKGRVEAEALMRVAIGLMYENLVNRGWTVDARTLMRLFHEVPSVVEQAFPGYAASGMLRMIIKGRSKHVRQK